MGNWFEDGLNAVYYAPPVEWTRENFGYERGGDQWQNAFAIMGLAGGTTASGGKFVWGAADDAAKVAAKPWWQSAVKPAAYTGAGVGILSVGPWLGGKFEDTATSVGAGVGGAVSEAIKPIAGYAAIALVGFLAYTFLASPKSAS